MAFQKGYAKDAEAVTRRAEELRVKRDEAIRAAYRDGLPMQAIAQVLGMSHQRVSEIVRS